MITTRFTSAWLLVIAAGLTSLLSGCNSGGDTTTLDAQTAIESNITTQTDQIGGASTSAVRYVDGSGTNWALFNMSDYLKITPISTTKGSEYTLSMGSYIRDIKLVDYGGNHYALVALGRGGIGVVNINDPANMQYLYSVKVHYEQTGITFTEGGGDILTNQTISSTDAPISSLETDGTSLWIGDEGYGIQKTALSNLIGSSPVTNADGTLKIDSGVYTLQYAGENPWGGPLDLKLVNGHLYAALGFLGIGIYNPTTLAREGGYNLYTDTSVSEDWDVNMNVATQVQSPSANYLDPVTGMPNYEQAAFEINQVWRDGVSAPTPWADFDRYGKYYYNARKLDVATNVGAGNNQTYVYIAYGLGGLVAVNATNPASVSYLGYAPAVPAHGPDKATGQQSKSIFPHFGSGMLKEAGVVDVDVDVANNTVYYADHFAGLVALSSATDPSAWHGPNGLHAYNNNTSGTLGDHWPDYEFVTSYDMSPADPTVEESLPKWLTESPALLATGEISGHGGPMFLMPGISSATGSVDLVQTTGAGGVNFIDLGNTSATAMADRFSVPVKFASTTEVAAGAGGSTVTASIGHTSGITADGRYLYVADGPHGMSVWQIADDNGNPIDQPHIVANTLQSEDPVTVGGVTILPTPHAYGVVLNGNDAYVMSQSLGVRRVDIADVLNGNAKAGAPLLLAPTTAGIYEHSAETGKYGGLKGQDHAYDMVIYGNYGIVADGSNGLTVYNLSVNPSVSDPVVANLGGTSGQPELGRALAVKLWTDTSTGKIYALVAAGSSGIAVVDMTGLLVNGQANGMTLIKRFEPIKMEGTKVGAADGHSVDMKIVGNYAYVSYDSFGILCYKMSDLIAPLPSGISATAVWDKAGSYDYRPHAMAHFRLQDQAGYASADGSAQYMTAQYFPADKPLLDANGHIYVRDTPKLIIYAAYGTSGVVKLDWTDPANPVMLQHKETVGTAEATAIAYGRVYVADSDGGVVVLK
ncbi:LVIVD repeat-containing protein [Mangrovitalea sediminis]|uniref:hypothetical protein n=1 Tax=Mangrovitalea sediminis TaxID=1982043 RepID=UPI001178C9DD|nr:hypothetical protein [Mangrovitalea sediminis]